MAQHFGVAILSTTCCRVIVPFGVAGIAKNICSNELFVLWFSTPLPYAPSVFGKVFSTALRNQFNRAGTPLLGLFDLEGVLPCL
jgi:hypothetical protein